jgi:hypothetical protein
MNTITNNINKCNERIVNIKRMLNNTETVGKSTLVELSSQGEQIKNCNKKSSLLYDQFKITKSKLHNIASSMPFANLLFNNETNIFKFLKEDVSQMKINNSNLDNVACNIQDGENNFENHTDIDDISKKIRKLKSIAIDINNEIKEQNVYINNLSTNIDKLNNIATDNNNIIQKSL